MLYALVDNPWINKRTISSKAHNNISFRCNCCLFVSLNYVQLWATPAVEIVINSKPSQFSIACWYSQPDIITQFGCFRRPDRPCECWYSGYLR